MTAMTVLPGRHSRLSAQSTARQPFVRSACAGRRSLGIGHPPDKCRGAALDRCPSNTDRPPHGANKWLLLGRRGQSGGAPFQDGFGFSGHPSAAANEWCAANWLQIP